MASGFTDLDAARALVDVFSGVRWNAVAMAEGFLLLDGGEPKETAARAIYQNKGDHADHPGMGKGRRSVRAVVVQRRQ